MVIRAVFVVVAVALSGCGQAEVAIPAPVAASVELELGTQPALWAEGIPVSAVVRANPPGATLPDGRLEIASGDVKCAAPMSPTKDGAMSGACVLRTVPGVHEVRASWVGPSGAIVRSNIRTAILTSGWKEGPRPEGTELCGFNPRTTFEGEGDTKIATADLPDAIPSLGIARSITGTQQLAVAIDSPLASDAMLAETTDVAGHFTGPENTGIVVNGMTARTAHGQFLARKVPVISGTITAVATTLAGDTARSVVTVHRSEGLPAVELAIGTKGPPEFDDPNAKALTSQQMLELSYFGASVLTPPMHEGDTHYYAFRANNLPAGAHVKTVVFDVDGDGTPELVGGPDLSLSWTQPASPGLTRTVLTVVTDHDERFVAAKYTLHDQPAVTLAMLCDVHGWLKARLRAGDAEGAAKAYSREVRQSYAAMFAQKDKLPEIADALGHVVTMQSDDDFAQAMVVRDEGEKRSGFELMFAREEDGIWRIGQM